MWIGGFATKIGYNQEMDDAGASSHNDSVEMLLMVVNEDDVKSRVYGVRCVVVVKSLLSSVSKSLGKPRQRMEGSVQKFRRKDQVSIWIRMNLIAVSTAE
jgi:hypothetical protein